MKKIRNLLIVFLLVLGLVLNINSVEAAKKSTKKVKNLNFSFKLDYKGGKAKSGALKTIYAVLNPNGISLDEAVKFYSDSSHKKRIYSVDVPYKLKYGFEGFYYDKTKVISRRGNIKDEFKQKIKSLKKSLTNKKLEGHWKTLTYKVNLKANTNDKKGTTELYFAEPYEGVAYTKNGKQTDKITIPTKKGYKFIGYEPVKFQNKEYETISSNGSIIGIAHPKNLESNASLWNKRGYKIKSMLLYFYRSDTKGTTLSLNAKWQQVSDINSSSNDSEENESEEDAVVKPITKINVKQDTMLIKEGDTAQIETVLEPIDTTQDELVFTSSDEKTISVDNSGLITAIRCGKAEITINAKENEEIETKVKVIVSKDGLAINSDEIMTVEVGKSEKIIPLEKVEDIEGNTIVLTDDSAVIEQGKYGYKIENSEFATITNEEVTGIKVGQTRINVFNSNKELIGTIIVEVEELSSTIEETDITEEVKNSEKITSLAEEKLNEIENTANVDNKKTETNKPIVVCYMKKNTLKPEETKFFEYEGYKGSSEPTVKVDDKSMLSYNKKTNKITAKKNEGVTSLTLKFKEGNVKCQILITKKIKKSQQKLIDADTTAQKLRKKSAQSDLMPIRPIDSKYKITNCTSSIKVGKTTTCKTVGYKSSFKTSNKNIATVNNNGKVTGKKAGTVTITATYKNKKATKKIKVEKKVKTTKSASKNTNTSSSNSTSSTKKSSSGSNTSSKKSTSKSNSKTKVKMNCTNDKVTVGKTIICTTPNDKSTFKSSNKKIATVDSKGKVKGVKAGTVTITVTSKDKNKTSNSKKITVKKNNKKKQ